jgi:N-carbamoyl-D-amino-acid hydrolase
MPGVTRRLPIAVGQLGPIGRSESRKDVVARLVALLRQAKERGAALVVFPEMALTTFFSRWHIAEEAEIESFFEREMPNEATRPLFQAAVRLGIGFYLGYCELVESGNRKRRFNSSILVDRRGSIIGKYRKVHIPGSAANDPDLPFQHLEPLYFESGDLGFPVWDCFETKIGMCICNDRRWPETYRVMALQGAEVVVLGYNSPAQLPDWPEQNELRAFHHLVCMQAAAYQNGIWIAASGKAGLEEGVEMLAHSCIIAPSGQIVALAQSRGDELISFECDLELSQGYKRFFDFARNRKPEHYGLIVAPGSRPETQGNLA